MNQRIWLLSSGFLGIALAGACSDDDVQSNPHYTAGTSNNNAGAPAGGEPNGIAGNGELIPVIGGTHSGSEAGMPGLGGSESTTPGGGGATLSSSAGTGTGADAGTGGGGGDGSTVEQPPYDCVLHPTTHLEIINACTDAVRIEKHPVLPAIPQQ